MSSAVKWRMWARCASNSQIPRRQEAPGSSVRFGAYAAAGGVSQTDRQSLFRMGQEAFRGGGDRAASQLLLLGWPQPQAQAPTPYPGEACAHGRWGVEFPQTQWGGPACHSPGGAALSRSMCAQGVKSRGWYQAPGGGGLVIVGGQ